MDWSVFPHWVWTIVRDPITPIFVMLMTCFWLYSLVAGGRQMQQALSGLTTLIAEISAQRDVDVNVRRRWVIDGKMVAAFRAAGLEMRGRELRATASSLVNGNVALDRDEVSRVLDPKASTAALLPTGSASTGFVMVGMGAIGTFSGIVLGLSGIQVGLTAANSAVFLRAVGDLLDGAALAFLTSLYGLCANLVSSKVHRGRVARLLVLADALLIATYEGLNPSTDTEFLRRELSKTRLAMEQTAAALSKGLGPITMAVAKQTDQDLVRTKQLIAHLNALQDAGLSRSSAG